ncbi:helix-turn-helix domain-containing protein [Rhizobium sp. NPDC090279]|uniref:helix-turn-helix domain-containing protein n=1 Tax=Rhizobium sp. NPDC090279 TaxID=3364499 RepID=UPI00383BD53A
MMKQPAFTSAYQISAARAASELKTKTLLRALVSRLRIVFSGDALELSATFVGGADPHVLICDQAAETAGRVTIDAETGLYVFCELGGSADDIVIVTASEKRLIEEIALHLGDGGLPLEAVDAAVGSLVGQTMQDVERKLILQTLHHCDGDPTHTAFMLGMPLVTLCNKLAVYFSDPAGELPQTAAETGYGAKSYRL